MKKIISLISLMMIAAMTLSAQVKLEFKAYKTTTFTKGSWQSWPSKLNSSMKDFGFVPYVNIKKIDSEIFNLNIYMGSNGSFTYNVVYDPTKTSETRKRLNNNNITVYRPTGDSGFIIWTQNATLAELHSSPSKWTSNTQSPNFYMWFTAQEGEEAYMYTYNVPSEVKKAKISTTFKDVISPVKGSYTDFPQNFKPAPGNSYVEITAVKEWSKYNMKFYENGRLVKDYTVSYDQNLAANIKTNDKKWNMYSIDGVSGAYIYLYNVSLRGLIENPGSWASKTDAVMWIYDEVKTGNRTRVK